MGMVGVGSDFVVSVARELAISKVLSEAPIQEMIARAAYEGDANLFLQALCLDPYVHTITQAKGIWADYVAEYHDQLPMFYPSDPRGEPALSPARPETWWNETGDARETIINPTIGCQESV